MNGYRSKSRELVFQIIFGLNFYENKMDDYEEIINEFESELKENDYEINIEPVPINGKFMIHRIGKPVEYAIYKYL